MSFVLAKYNDQEYEVEMYIDDGTGSSNRFYINPAAIVNLNIEDTLADWVVRGSITIYNTFESLEGKPSNSIGSSNTDFYFFRNDGNDTLHIRIYPNLKGIGFSVDRKHWELVYKFTIYDSEDIDNVPGAQNAASANMKCKKFYFWDSWYQKMITNTMEYSTALSNNTFSTLQNTGGSFLENFLRTAFNGLRFGGERSFGGVPGQGLSDENRSILTGQAMKEIIEKALTDNNSSKLPYTDLVGGSDRTAWDFGASGIFYTAPATYSAYDSLMYVYSRHISSIYKGGIAFNDASSSTINDFCILYKERGPKVGNEGYFALRPLTNFFERAGKGSPGDFLIERFILQGYTTDSKSVKLNAGPAFPGQNMQINTSLGPYSTITKYNFVDISPYTNATQLRTSPVYSFDFRTRRYNVDFSSNSVETAKNFINSNYISQLFSLGNTPDKLSLLTFDGSKRTRNIKPVFSVYGENKLQRQADGLQKLLKTGVFQNTAINFRVMGSTNRNPGRFILIDKPDGIEDTPFNNKFFGQWFIINVKHIFEGGAYYNDITAVKLHRIKPAPVTLPNTI